MGKRRGGKREELIKQMKWSVLARLKTKAEDRKLKQIEISTM